MQCSIGIARSTSITRSQYLGIKMRTSAAGIAIIKKYEGCKLTAYRDTIADPPVWTIGYGDTLNVRQGMTITQQEAEDGLTGRLAREFEPGVLAALQLAPVSQPQFD